MRTCGFRVKGQTGLMNPRFATISCWLLVLAWSNHQCLAADPPDVNYDENKVPAYVDLIPKRQIDGELPGWKSFHESPGARTGEVWQLQADGVLICKGSPRGYLYTEREYKDFTLRFEWRYPVGANQSNGGVLVRMTGPHGIWPRCLELQLNRGQAGDFWAIGGYAVTGPIDRMKTITNSPLGTLHHIPRLADVEKPVGEWNEHEATVVGDSVVQRLNGMLVNQVTGCESIPGRILLTAEGQEIQFRNIRLYPKRSPESDHAR